jgi:hypothetical protein
VTGSIRFHAIYLVLGDEVFLEPSIRSVYDHVDAITIVTAYDRTWSGDPRPPSPAVEMVLERAFDPDRKISLVVAHHTSEARCRNAVMDMVTPPGRRPQIRPQGDYDVEPALPDYYLIVDADEAWDGEDIERLRTHIASDRLPSYRAGAHRYFTRWRYRIDGLEWSTVAIRSDVRFHHLRNVRQRLWQRALGRALRPWPRWRARVTRIGDVPAEVAVFHHGSYVGPRERIAAKLAASGHAHEVQPNWMEEVWDGWTPERRNLNPVWPELYPQAREIPLEALPEQIRTHRWPDEYLE